MTDHHYAAPFNRAVETAVRMIVNSYHWRGSFIPQGKHMRGAALALLADLLGREVDELLKLLVPSPRDLVRREAFIRKAVEGLL